MTPRCGRVALVGAPNAGKSTLLNRAVGAHVAITSSKPQTTRDRIVGVVTRGDAQLVLVDTPGLHQGPTELNRAMIRQADAALDEADALSICLDAIPLARRVEAERPPLDDGLLALATRTEALGRPVVVALNKVDVVPKPLLLPVLAALATAWPRATLLPISALTGDGVDRWLDALVPLLPEGPHAFDAETYTTETERALVAEIVREKVFHFTEKEIPYSTAVEVLLFDEDNRETEGRIRILADVIVERDSQKGIIIGAGGEMLKRIGTAARKDIAVLLGARVHLELHVKVEKDWSRSAKGLRRVGFRALG